jgi:hypothetical protein
MPDLSRQDEPAGVPVSRRALGSLRGRRAGLAPVEDEAALGEQPRVAGLGECVEVAQRCDHDLALAVGRGEVVLGDGGQIITQNFDTYPVMRMQSAPQIEVLLIESGEPPTGVGEVSVPTAAPALTSAIFALTGTGSAGCPSPRPSGSTEE